MANQKISQLNQATAYTLNDIVAIVDSGFVETKKININDILRNTNNVVESATNTNGIFLATDAFSANFQVLRGTNTTSAVVGSNNSYIQNGQNAFIGGTQSCNIENAAGHNAIVGSDGVSITNGYNHFIGGSYSGPRISGGEENVILASVGGSEIQGGANNLIAATQGFVMGGNSYKNAGIGAEAGGWAGPRYSVACGGYQLTSNNAQGNQFFAGAYENLTFDSLGGYIYQPSALSTLNCQVSHGRSSMIAASGRTTLYDYTLHTDNIHTYQGNSTEWRQGGDVSGAINVDLSTGNLFSFRLTGNLTSVQLDNAKMGGEYEFFVENSGSYTITTINLDGNASSIYSSGGALNPTNNGFSFYRLRIVDDGSGNKRGVMKEFLNYSAI